MLDKYIYIIISVKFCQGLCPNIRKQIMLGNERDIYKKGECAKIIKKRLNQAMEWLINDKNG